MARQWAFAAAILAFWVTTATAHAADGPMILIRPAAASLVPGEPIGLDVIVANPTADVLEFAFRYPFLPIWTEVQSPDGRPLRRDLIEDPVAIAARRPRIMVIGGAPPRTRLAPSGRWRGTVYVPPTARDRPPGRYRLAYDLQLPYRSIAGMHEPWTEDTPFPRAATVKGELEFDLRGVEPGELGRRLDAYVAQAAAAGPPFADVPARLAGWCDGLADAVVPGLGSYLAGSFGEFLRRRDARGASEGLQWPREGVEALSILDDPIVIPRWAAALGAGVAPEAVFRGLEQFRDREDARRIVAGALRSGRVEVVVPALDWLAECRQDLEPESLRELLLGNRDQGHILLAAFQYVEGRGPEAYPSLGPAVVACLSYGGQFDRDDVRTHALRLLAAWDVGESPTVRDALGRLEVDLLAPSNSQIGAGLEVLRRWGRRVEAGRLRTLLTRPGLPAWERAAVLAYFEGAPPPGYRGLQPQVVALLDDGDAGVVVAALRVLKGWGYRLGPDEQDRLMRRGDEAREATVHYLSPTP